MCPLHSMCTHFSHDLMKGGGCGADKSTALLYLQSVILRFSQLEALQPVSNFYIVCEIRIHIVSSRDVF